MSGLRRKRGNRPAGYCRVADHQRRPAPTEASSRTGGPADTPRPAGLDAVAPALQLELLDGPAQVRVSRPGEWTAAGPRSEPVCARSVVTIQLARIAVVSSPAARGAGRWPAAELVVTEVWPAAPTVPQSRR